MMDNYDNLTNTGVWNQSDNDSIASSRGLEICGSVPAPAGSLEYVFRFFSTVACIVTLIVVLGHRQLRHRQYFCVIYLHVLFILATTNSDIIQVFHKGTAGHMFVSVIDQSLRYAQNLSVTTLVVFWRRRAFSFCTRETNLLLASVYYGFCIAVLFATPMIMYLNPESVDSILILFNLADYLILFILIMSFNVMRSRNTTKHVELGIGNTYLVLRFWIYLQMEMCLINVFVFDEYVLGAFVILSISYPIFNLIYLCLFDETFGSAATLGYCGRLKAQQTKIENGGDRGDDGLESMNLTNSD